MGGGGEGEGFNKLKQTFQFLFFILTRECWEITEKDKLNFRECSTNTEQSQIEFKRMMRNTENGKIEFSWH